ncbi:MAG: transposase [Candidatus Omnitrophica bacterium]|nr:transposase [Candidatus Omnitrophota bacterium]
MPRLPRVYIENSVYYITCNGLQNQVIFKDTRDYEMYFGLLRKYKDQYGAKLYAYTLLHNHLHLLMEVDNKSSISTMMHDLTSSYTKYFNGRYDRKGHLFRERFKAAVVEKDPQILLNLTAYIHLNSDRLNIAIQGQTYEYSSYGLYLEYSQASDRGLDIKNEIEKIINGLIGENYLEFIQRMQGDEEFKKHYKKLQRKGIIGSKDFMNHVQQEIDLQRQEPNNPRVEENKSGIKNKFISAGTALLLVAITAGGAYLYFDYNAQQKKTAETKGSAAVTEQRLIDLNNTEWQIEMFNIDGSVARSDIISFVQGKFTSGYFSQFKFPNINYSTVMEGNKIIWETIQTSAEGTASWRGEVVKDQMLGMVSLQLNGKQTENLSFKSLKFMRK